MPNLDTDQVAAAAGGFTAAGVLMGWLVKAFSLGRSFDKTLDKRLAEHRDSQQRFIRDELTRHATEEKRHFDLMREDMLRELAVIRGDVTAAHQRIDSVLARGGK